MKGVVIHALLALFGLVFAYQTYTRKPEAEGMPGAVTVAECSRDQITKLTLNTANVEIKAEPVRANGATTFWITTRHRTPEEVVSLDPTKNPSKSPQRAPSAQRQAAAGGGAELGAAGAQAKSGEGDKPDAKPGELPEANRPKRFLANSVFEAYLKRLTPVLALRSLGKLDSKQDEDFGFGKVLTYLELECGGHTLELQSGTRSFGSNQRYLRDTKTGITYLFDEPTVSDLESAQFKFMQADLHTWKPEDVEELVVQAQGAKKKLLQRDRKLSGSQWVDEAAPAKRNELYNNWVSRLGKLRARSYLERGAEPGSDLKAAGSATPVMRVDYKVEGRPAGVVELVKVDENGVAHYYARSETTQAWVALFDSAAKDVEQDVGMVVGVEQPADAEARDKPGKNAPARPASSAGPHGAQDAPGPKSNEDFLPAGHPRIPAGH